MTISQWRLRKKFLSVEDIVPARALREYQLRRGRCYGNVSYQSSGDEVTAHVLAWSLQVCVAIRVARSKGRDGCGERTAEMLLAPRMLLFRKTRGGMIPKGQLQERFALFRRGDWTDLLLQSRDVSEEATAVRSRSRRTQVDTVERRAERAQALVTMGEISSGRAALEGAPVAPGNEATLNSLRDESRRPPSL